MAHSLSRTRGLTGAPMRRVSRRPIPAESACPISPADLTLALERVAPLRSRGLSALATGVPLGRRFGRATRWLHLGTGDHQLPRSDPPTVEARQARHAAGVHRRDRHHGVEHAVANVTEDGAARATAPLDDVAHRSAPMHSPQSRPSMSTGFAPHVAQRSMSSSVADASVSIAAPSATP